MTRFLDIYAEDFSVKRLKDAYKIFKIARDKWNQLRLHTSKSPYLRSCVHNPIIDIMVKNLLLIRHAEAQFPTSEKRDFERDLTTNGEKQATLLGMHINKLGLQFDALYHSPAERTVQTAKGISRQLDYDLRLIESEELYEATSNLFKAFVNRLDALYGNVMIVAHNPAIAEVYAHYVMDIRDFSPATSALLSFEIDDWNLVSGHMATERDYYYPGMR